MKRKFVGIALFIGVLLNFPFVAIAAERPAIVDKKIYKELKDPDEILELTIKQYKERLAKREISNDRIVVTQLLENQDDILNDEIIATQLLEKDTYSDGKVETTYATTSLLVLDENNEKVGISELASYVFDGSTSTAGGKYSLVNALTVYWTEYYDGSTSTIKSNYTTNMIVGNTSGNYFVTQLDCVFTSCQDPALYPDYTDHIYFTAPSTYTTYTAYNPRPRYLYWSYFGYSKAGATIKYNDGSQYDIYVDLFSILQYGD